MKKKMIWIGIIVLAAVALGYGLMPKNQAVDVEVSKVERGNIDQYIEEIATVSLENETSIYATVGGKVVEITAEIGEEIKVGDVLARLDDKEMLLQIKALEAQKQSTLAQYEEAKSPVKQEEINKLTAQVRSAEAAYEEAKRVETTNKVLYENNAISFDTYQNSLSQLTTAEANLESAKNNLALAQKGISNHVRNQYQAQIAGIQAQIDLLYKQLNDLSIQATNDGTVIAKEIETASFVQPGQLLFEIGNIRDIFLESDILVEDIRDVKLGADVIIENDDLGITGLKGTIRKIYPKAFSKLSDLGIEQKRIKVEIDFIDKIEVLKPGYDLDIKIITESKNNTLLVDEKAVFEYQGKDHVFVVDNGTATLRAIETGIESDNWVEVLKGLQEGEEIILSPDEKISEGIKIK